MTNHEAESGYELVLDNRKLILWFAALIAFCCCFFVLGFIEGKRQGIQEGSQTATESQSKVSPDTEKPQNGKSVSIDEQANTIKQSNTDQPLDWYKNVSSREAAPAKIPPEPAKTQAVPTSVPFAPATGPSAPAKIPSTPTADVVPKPAAPKPEMSHPEKPKTQVNAPSVTYSVQVGAFSQKQALDATAKLLRDKGFDYRIEPPQADGQLYRLLVGKFRTRPEAAAMKLRLQKNGFSPFIKTNTGE